MTECGETRDRIGGKGSCPPRGKEESVHKPSRTKHRHEKLVRGGAMKPFGSIRFPTVLRCALVLAALMAPQAVQAAAWQAIVGAQSRDMGRQALAFLPNELWV